MFETVDDARFSRALRSHHRVSSRVEVWSEGRMITYAAPFVDGSVTDTWVAAGVRRNLSLSVPPTVDWLKWLNLPVLEFRPYRGVQYRVGDVSECPLGRFPVFPPERSLPVQGIKITADDYYQRIGNATFSYPVQTATEPVVFVVARLLGTGGQIQGLVDPVIQTTNDWIAAASLLEKSRHDAILNYAKSFNLEVFIDRHGVPVIRDAQVLGVPVATLDAAVVEQVTIKPDDSKVFNQVSVTSSAQGVEFDAQIAIARTDSPAAAWRIGPKVLLYSSPVIMDAYQALAAAKTILAKVSGAALTYAYSSVPDPRLDAGDTVKGMTPDGGLVDVQIASVTHPLGAEGRQQVTTVSTQAPI